MYYVMYLLIGATVQAIIIALILIILAKMGKGHSPPESVVINVSKVMIAGLVIACLVLSLKQYPQQSAGTTHTIELEEAQMNEGVMLLTVWEMKGRIYKNPVPLSNDAARPHIGRYLSLRRERIISVSNWSPTTLLVILKDTEPEKQ